MLFMHNGVIQRRARETSRFYRGRGGIRGKPSVFHKVKEEDGSFQFSQVTSWLDKCFLSWAVLSAYTWCAGEKRNDRLSFFNAIFLQQIFPLGDTDPTGKSDLMRRQWPFVTERRPKPHWPCLWFSANLNRSGKNTPVWAIHCQVEICGNEN